MRDRGITLGIGTDGCLSSDNQNVFEAMRMAAFSSRVQGPDPRQWLTAAEVFEAATKGGARALGMESLDRSACAGFKADVVFLDLTSINYVPLNDPLLHVVFVRTAPASIASWSAAECWWKAARCSASTWRSSRAEAEYGRRTSCEGQCRGAGLRACVRAGGARLLRGSRARALSRASLVRAFFLMVRADRQVNYTIGLLEKFLSPRPQRI